MISKLSTLFVLALLGTTAAEAADCPILPIDITADISRLSPGGTVSTRQFTDPSSDEPVRHYAMTLEDGSLLTVQQKHCMMHNLTVTLVSTAAEPSAGHLELLADAFAMTPTAQAWFASDARDVLLSEFASARFQDAVGRSGASDYAIDDRLSASNETSEALLGVARFEVLGLPYQSIVSIYVGVGGL